LANSESTQTQLDTIVIEGDSSVEAAQARVTKDGETYGTLKERLDGEHSEVTQQLAENEQEINKKMDKGTTNISVSQINKNKGLLDESYFTEKTKEQWTGNTPISSTPIA